MPQVTISSIQYESYADLDEANAYLNASASGAAWRALEDDDKGRMLVSATRLFDRTCWLGEKTDGESQPLAWPRSGISGVDELTIPAEIMNGFFELVAAMAGGSTVESNATPGAQQLEIIKAGSVMLQYFRGAESLNAQLDRFPLAVQENVKAYLCGANSQITGVASGVNSDETSVTGDNFGYNEGI